MPPVYGCAPLDSGAATARMGDAPGSGLPAASSGSMPSGATPLSLLAATEMTRVPVDGEPTMPATSPELPAAATTTAPISAAFEQATAVGSSGVPYVPPSERLMTLATGLA